MINRFKKIIKKLKPYKVNLFVYGIDTVDDVDFGQIKELNFDLKYNRTLQTYQIFKDNELIHSSRIFERNFLLKSFGFNAPFIAIGDCFTAESKKGQGIYPWVISRIVAEYHATRNIYMLVSPSNIPSIKGIKKAGLRKKAHIKCFKVGPLYFSKKQLDID